MTNGVVFDIKELSVYDGPGVRTTVFFKGCPLRCQWCHNPEGLSPKPEIMVSASCVHCGKCAAENCGKAINGICTGCGGCVSLCPNGFRNIAGRRYSCDELTERLMKYRDWYGEDGGVTFSGGEPTMQFDFLRLMLVNLREKGVKTAVQTCGYCDEDDFRELTELTDLIFFDIKHPNPAEHKKYTGRSNEPILRNLRVLKSSATPFIIRVPVIHGVNDSRETLSEIAGLASDAKNLIRVELLSYNMAAGAKYSMVGRDYSPDFEQKPPEIDASPFLLSNIEAIIRK